MLAWAIMSHPSLNLSAPLRMCACRGSLRPAGIGPGSARVGSGRGGGSSGLDDATDQLELFLSSGRSSSRCGPPVSHLAPAIAAQDLARNHPGRTASPATAALTAAAAMAMKQHELEVGRARFCGAGCGVSSLPGFLHAPCNQTFSANSAVP